MLKIEGRSASKKRFCEKNARKRKFDTHFCQKNTRKCKFDTSFCEKNTRKRDFYTPSMRIFGGVRGGGHGGVTAP